MTLGLATVAATALQATSEELWRVYIARYKATQNMRLTKQKAREARRLVVRAMDAELIAEHSNLTAEERREVIQERIQERTKSKKGSSLSSIRRDTKR